MERDRVEPRTRATIHAHLRHDHGEGDVHILDLSTRGLLAMMPDPPRRGSFVEFSIGRHVIVGHVKWSGPKRFGVGFRDRISVAALLSGEAGPITLDRTAAATARGGGLGTALAVDPQGFSRFGQFVVLALALTVGGLVLAEVVTDSLAPLEQARRALATAP